MDQEIATQLGNNQQLLAEEIDIARQEIGENFVNIGQQMDELQEILYGPENVNG